LEATSGVAGFGGGSEREVGLIRFGMDETADAGEERTGARRKRRSRGGREN